MNNTWRPMLAAAKKPSQTDEDYWKVIEKNLPLILQPKIDGIRCLIGKGGIPFTRSQKPIPNIWVRNCLKDLRLPYGFDGELITFTDASLSTQHGFNTISSQVMSQLGTPHFLYMVFDWYRPEKLFNRIQQLSDVMPLNSNVRRVESIFCTALQTVKDFMQLYLDQGYEGAMLRHPYSPYKSGPRVTQREFFLAKLKPFEKSIATIVGYEELMINDNTQTSSIAGLSVRTSHKENLRGGNTLGSLVVADRKVSSVDFNIGTGFTAENRKEIWNHTDFYTGRNIEYKYQANRTKKDKPISPVFLRFL